MSRVSMLLAVIALIPGFAAIALALSPGPLYASDALDLMSAFSLFLDAAPLAGLFALGLGLTGLVTGLVGRAWRSAAIAFAAALAGGGVWLVVDDFISRAAANPLHDVTTNVDVPPAFSATEPRRYEAGSAAARAASPHPDWRAAHEAIYPDLETLVQPLDVGEASRRAETVAAKLGWSVHNLDRSDSAAHLEAIDMTGWFGFTDDIVVTIVSRDDGGVAVDVRSVSRIGIGDVGKNAERVREFLREFQNAR